MSAGKNISLALLAAVFILLQGCGSKKEPKTVWNVSLDRDNKAPYGTYITRTSLPYYFPDAHIEDISRRFRYTSIDQGMQYHGDSTALFVMLGLEYYLSDEEWIKLKEFISIGNEVFIISSTLDNKIEQALNCTLNGGAEEYPLSKYNTGADNVQALSLMPDTTVKYGHKGRALTGNFSLKTTAAEIATADADSAKLADYSSEPQVAESEGDTFSRSPVVLGKSKNTANFIRYAYGSGHITLLAAPLAMSNYFLLQKNNRNYLDGIWHSFPASISHIYWNEYYKRSTEGSDLGVLWRYPATRWALILAISTLLAYVLFGLKRRQRIVPVIKPVENASVSFVETVGRLYYNKSNHANLAEKMIQHFMEWVRSYYYLDTSHLNDVFVKQLVSKSGKSEAEVQQLVQSIHDIRLGSVAVTEAYLYQLHSLLQSFYDNNRN